jgi:hypothetical protein
VVVEAGLGLGTPAEEAEVGPRRRRRRAVSASTPAFGRWPFASA